MSGILKKHEYSIAEIPNTSMGRLKSGLLSISPLLAPGIFIVSGEMVRSAAGPGSALAYIISTVFAAATAACWSELAGHHNLHGTTASAVQHSLGNLALWFSACNQAVQYLLSTVACARLLTTNLGILLASDPEHLLLRDSNGLNLDLPAAVSITAAALLISYDTKHATFFNCITSIVAVVLLIWLGSAALSVASTDMWQAGLVGSTATSLDSCCYAWISYMGFEVITLAAEDVKDAHETIPGTMYQAIGIACACFTFTAMAVTGIQPYSSLHRQDAYGRALSIAGFSWGRKVAAGTSAVAAAAAIVGLMFALTRLLVMLSTEGMLPHLLATLDGPHKTPRRSCLVAAVAASSTAALVSPSVIRLAALCSLFAWLLTSAALLVSWGRAAGMREWKVLVSVVTIVSSSIACAVSYAHSSWIASACLAGCWLLCTSASCCLQHHSSQLPVSKQALRPFLPSSCVMAGVFIMSRVGGEAWAPWGIIMLLISAAYSISLAAHACSHRHFPDILGQQSRQHAASSQKYMNNMNSNPLFGNGKADTDYQGASRTSSSVELISAVSAGVKTPPTPLHGPTVKARPSLDVTDKVPDKSASKTSGNGKAAWTLLADSPYAIDEAGGTDERGETHKSNVGGVDFLGSPPRRS